MYYENRCNAKAMRYTVEDFEINVFGNLDSERWVIEPIGNWETEKIQNQYEEINKLNKGIDFCFLAVTIRNWNQDLSPWKEDAVFGNENFGDGAKNTLLFITEKLISGFSKHNPCKNRKIYLCGYSLAGLFALWSSYQTDLFYGIASASPSVWFHDWILYSETHDIHTNYVYLSLGTKEEKTKNPVLSSVGDCIRKQEVILKSKVNCTLDWNPGNHFVDSDIRMAKAVTWLLKNSNKKTSEAT